MIMMPRRAVRRLLLSIGATLASAWAVPVSAGPLTYEQAVRLAAANAPSLKARAAATAGARSSAAAADRLPDPTLDLGLQNFPVSGPNAGSFTRDDFTMATIGFSQTFPNLAKRHARAARAAADIGIAEAGELVEGRNVRLDLVSPLGQTLAIITATPSGATLDLPNEAPRNAPEVDSLMEQALGFSLPVSGMRDWLHGRAAPGTPSNITRDANGRPDTLRQSGWTVRYLAWQDTPENATPTTTLPRRIDMARDGNESPLSVRLVIDPENKE